MNHKSFVFFDCECANTFDGVGKICSLGYVICDDDLNIIAGVGERDADMRVIRNDPYLTRTRYNVIHGQNEYIHKGQRVN